MRKIPVLLLSSTALLTSVISNAMAAQVGDLQTFKLTPTIDFRADTGDKTVGKLQSLIPILGNENRLFYAFGEGKAGRSSDNGWMVGAGTGYRQVINDAAILGGYVIADYSSSPTKKRFWIANPGVELFTTNWDFRANAYIPMGKNDWSTSTTQTGWADEFGVYDYVKYSGHNQYNRMMSVQQTTREETNSGVGGDAEIGRAIPHIAGLKAYVGGYYYNTANLGHVRGIEGRVTYQLTDHIGLEAIDTHDNLKNNTFLLGLKISFGGFDKKERAQFGISGRLLEPIEHNLATTANGYAAPVKTGTQTTKTFIASNKNNTLSNILKNAQSPTAALTSTDPSTDDYLFVERDNIWYFKAGNISPTPTGKGTYEDPFVSFSQANYKTIDPSLGQNDPSLYFASGSYTFSDFQSRDISNRFMLPSGWSMYGRADNYSRQALGDERPQFNGGLDIGSYSQASRFNTLDSLKITNVVGNKPYSHDNATIYITNAANVVFDNTAIKSNLASEEPVPGASDAVGIYANNSTLNLQGLGNSIDVVGSKANGSEATGIYAWSTTVNFTANQGFANKINVTLPTLTAPYDDRAIYGIDAFEASTINFNDGTNTITANGGQIVGIDLGYGSKLNFVNGINTIINSTATTSGSWWKDSSYSIFASHGSEINFIGGKNTIKMTTDAQMSSGIVLIASTLNFNGGINNIEAVSQSNSTSGIDVGDISSDPGPTQINFLGGTNNISAHTEQRDFAKGISLGTNENPVTLNFSGGDNTIIATTGGAYYTPSALYLAYESKMITVNFTGGTNTLTAIANNGHATGAAAIDSYATEATINFIGGTNVLNAKANTGEAYGIYTSDKSKNVTLNFAGDNSSPHLAINVAAPTAYGISTLGTQLQFNGKTQSISTETFQTMLKNYVDIHRLDDGISGYKVIWDDKTSLPWISN